MRRSVLLLVLLPLAACAARYPYTVDPDAGLLPRPRAVAFLNGLADRRAELGCGGCDQSCVFTEQAVYRVDGFQPVPYESAALHAYVLGRSTVAFVGWGPTSSVNGCSIVLNSYHPRTQGVVNQIASALVSLGVQPGITP